MTGKKQHEKKLNNKSSSMLVPDHKNLKETGITKRISAGIDKNAGREEMSTKGMIKSTMLWMSMSSRSVRERVKKIMTSNTMKAIVSCVTNRAI